MNIFKFLNTLNKATVLIVLLCFSLIAYSQNQNSEGQNRAISILSSIHFLLFADDLAPQLNDTGITFGGDFPSGNNTDCTGETIAQQDCSSGRDAQATAGTLIKVGAGAAGFDFTKLAADGSVLAIQDATYSATGSEAAGTLWSCVRDNVTGLIWEVKTDDENSEHYRNNTYRWGGLTAVGRDSPDRQGDFFDDWNTLVNSANADSGLCGFTDWRVPQRSSLRTIVHYGAFSPAIDTDFFPNTSSLFYWSSSPVADNSGNAWSVSFSFGAGTSNSRSDNDRVRLVRGGQ